MRSIMQYKKCCYFCSKIDDLERHHVIHGTAGRKTAEKLGLWIWLCSYHHRTGPEAVHKDAKIDENLKKHAQTIYESRHSHEEWMQHVGRNYL